MASTVFVWDRLAGPHSCSTAAWLRYCAADIDATFHAAVIRDAHGTPTGAVPAIPVGHLQEWSRYRRNEHLEKRGLSRVPDTGWLVGPTAGFQTNLLLAKGADESRERRVARLVDELRSSAGEGTPVVAMYMTTDDVVLARDAGVETEPVLLDFDAWIDPPEPSGDAWLACGATLGAVWLLDLTPDSPFAMDRHAAARAANRKTLQTSPSSPAPWTRRVAQDTRCLSAVSVDNSLKGGNANRGRSGSGRMLSTRFLCADPSRMAGPGDEHDNSEHIQHEQGELHNGGY